MRYCPVSVRLTPLSPAHAPHAFSGAYIDADSTQSCISVFHLPASELSNYRIHVAAPHLGDDLVWIRARVIDSVALFPEEIGHGAAKTAKIGQTDHLRPFLDNALRNGFRLFPLHSVKNGALRNMTVVQLGASMQDTVQTGLLPLHFAPLRQSQQLIVQSCPFGLSNPKLFADFRSSGGVCAVFADGYVTDCKYLENMIGAMVCTQDQQFQAGLVLGNLRKMNGDGDLAVVLAWSAVPFLEKEIMPSSFPENSPKRAAHRLQASASVLPIVFSSKNGSSWGSCVIYNETTLVTNNHVMLPLLRDPQVACHVTQDGRKIRIVRDQVVVPFEGLDLALVLYAGHFTGAPPSLCGGRPADPLLAAGYGLFSDKQEPLVAAGSICRTIAMPPFSGVEKPIPCMRITSTSCWNGSSGGGVFDCEGRFVGLISSNAQVYIPEVADQEPTQKTEKVPSFCFIIPAELIRLCYDEVLNPSGVKLNEKVVKAWNLETYYNESFQHEAKI